MPEKYRISLFLYWSPYPNLRGSDITWNSCNVFKWVCRRQFQTLNNTTQKFLGNLVVEIYLLIKFTVILNEDEFFPSRWITNTHPYKLWVVSTASSIREKATWQTHLR